MPKVTFKSTGDQAECEEGAELINVTREKGWPISYACEDGQCGTCIIKTAQGGLSEMDEKEKNTLSAMGFDDDEHRLSCQCKVQGDCEIEQP